MAFSRRFVDSNRVVEAIFNNDFGLSDEEDSESNDENDIYGYLGHLIVSRGKIIEAARDLVEEEAFETEDETTADASVLSLDNSTIHISRDSEDSNEDGMDIDSSEEMEVESEESTNQTVAEESLSGTESEVSGDITSYLVVICAINW